MTDDSVHLARELAGRILVDALDALTGPEAAKIRATFAARKSAWVEGDVTIPPAIYALLERADEMAAKMLRGPGIQGRQGAMFGAAR